ncbi:N2227-like protein-domain-containing protein [Plectosphaerella plurivora]|uniref:N2227-like protein-domain-containing protein n=1 Tax=Plectosphaerella plurivora TaxID=936078 RepID=A0A9P9AH57_9PEZI|nr:N2227-like protein-domain-containing protein [Plectosphaerella plurivora]
MSHPSSPPPDPESSDPANSQPRVSAQQPSQPSPAMRFPSMLAALLAATTTASEPVRDAAPVEDLASIPNDILEVHQVVMTVQEVRKPSPRHEAERKALQGRLSHSNGRWDRNHPRHRLLDALHAYMRYSALQTTDLDKWRRLYKSVPKEQKRLLEGVVDYQAKLDRVAHLLYVNQKLCDGIVEAGMAFYGVERKELDDHIKTVEAEGRTADKVSVSQSLKHYVRDWSVQGVSEREAAFPCILESLELLFPDRSAGDVKVLLPGAGVGRLGHDVSALGGFEVTSNEWSMYMNVAYRYLEANPNVNTGLVHPFVDGWSHHTSTADMMREVSFPDAAVNSSAVLLVEGDFTRAFDNQKGHYDALVTHFFIDTARNLLAYLETIYASLRKGGYWVNFGPLLYGTGPWVQLSLEEVLAVAESMGFEFVDAPESCGDITIPGRPVRWREAAYGFNDRALTKHAYKAQAWIMRKK